MFGYVAIGPPEARARPTRLNAQPTPQALGCEEGLSADAVPPPQHAVAASDLPAPKDECSSLLRPELHHLPLRVSRRLT